MNTSMGTEGERDTTVIGAIPTFGLKVTPMSMDEVYIMR